DPNCAVIHLPSRMNGDTPRAPGTVDLAKPGLTARGSADVEAPLPRLLGDDPGLHAGRGECFEVLIHSEQRQPVAVGEVLHTGALRHQEMEVDHQGAGLHPAGTDAHDLPATALP